MQSKDWGLLKIKLSEEQQEIVIELVSKNVSGKEIARKIGISQSKMWRQMEIMGLNKKKKCKKKKIKNKKVFSWNDFNNSII